MNKLLVSLVLSLGVAGSAYAQQGDAEAGQGKIAICTACHGADGNSMMPNWPSLASQGERYLLKQMIDIKAGTRVVPEMTGMLTNLDEQDMADIAAFYESQPLKGGAADAELAERGEAIYRGGDLKTGLPSCTGCHSPTGQGNEPAGYPHLAGQAGPVGQQAVAIGTMAGRTEGYLARPGFSIALLCRGRTGHT